MTAYSTFEMRHIDRHREEEFTLTPKKRPPFSADPAATDRARCISGRAAGETSTRSAEAD